MGFGSRYSLVLSDRWGYPGQDWAGRGRPWERPDDFERFVRELARRYRGRGLIYWDIWNEPDYPWFWDGTREQFFRTFAIAARAIKDELGDDALIVGPSTSVLRRDWIAGLAEHCLEAGCELNAVSWHDLRPSCAGLASLSDGVQAMRALLERPRYRPLGFAEVHVNEVIGPALQFQPAAHLAYFAELERARVDVGIKGCWPDSGGRWSCEAATLDGLIDEVSGRPRSAWHAWRAYAAGSGSRVRSVSRGRGLSLLASSGSGLPGAAQLLVANTGSPRGGASVRVCGLRGLRARRLRVSRELYPDTGERPLAKPSIQPGGSLRVEPGGNCASGRLRLPQPGEAAVFYLHAGASARPLPSSRAQAYP